MTLTFFSRVKPTFATNLDQSGQCPGSPGCFGR